MPVADAAVWREVGLAVYHRRIELGIETQQELAERAGVSLNTISRLERGVPSKRRNPTWAKIERALGWPEGKIAAMVAGQALGVITPAAVRQAVLDSIHEVGQDLTIRQAQEIAALTVERLKQQKLLPR